MMEVLPPKTTNPHRIACIKSLRTSGKRPYATVGNVLWMWYGRKYTWANKVDHLEDHFLPDIAFDLLDGYCQSDTWHRTYKTREEAVAAFERAVARLEHEL